MAVSRRKRWWSAALAVVTAIGLVAAAMWGVQEYRERANLRADCGVVERLGNRWEQLSDVSLIGDDKPEDWRALGTHVLEGAPSISAPAMQAQMNQRARKNK